MPIENEPQEDSIRADLEAAFDAPPEREETPEPPAAETEEPAREPAHEPEADEGSRERDERGRFKPREKDKPEGAGHGASEPPGSEKAGEAQPKPAVSPAAPVPAAPAEKPPVAATAERAPQSWKPAAREHWAALPPDVRAEVQRREAEVARTLQETVAARRESEAFRQTYAPYEAMIRAEGGEPMRAVAELFQTAAALRTAPPGHKAQLVANLVRHYGVPIEALDACLAGQPPPASAQQAPQAYRDPRVDQLFAQMQASQRARQEADQRAAAEAVEAFGASQEFFADVRQDMADLVELAHRRGRELSLPDAYKQACAMNPEIARVLSQREAASRARTPSGATARAQRAASSVKSSPAPAPAGQGSKGSVRDDLEAAIEELNAR